MKKGIKKQRKGIHGKSKPFEQKAASKNVGQAEIMRGRSYE
jgi:hypothetical protein